MTRRKPLVSLKRTSASYHHEPSVGLSLEHHRPGTQQVPQTFALFQSPDEQHRGAAIRELLKRFGARVEACEIDAVGNHAVISREVLADEVARRGRNGDTPVQLAEEGAQDGLAVEIRQRCIPKRVECADVGAAGVPQNGQRQGRHHRLVEMNQIELLLLQQAFGL